MRELDAVGCTHEDIQAVWNNVAVEAGYPQATGPP